MTIAAAQNNAPPADSYACGATEVPLIEQTIGAFFADMVARQPEREALVGHHVGKKGANGLLDQGNLGGTAGVAFCGRCIVLCGCNRHGLVSWVAHRGTHKVAPLKHRSLVPRRVATKVANRATAGAHCAP